MDIDKIKITNAALDDVMGISEVQKITWMDTYPNEKYNITKEDILSEDFYSKERIDRRIEAIQNPSSTTKFWVAKDGNKVIGYCAAKTDQTINYIRSLYVLPEYQHKGIGMQLIKKGLDYLDKSRPITLTTAPYNKKAISFYKKLGFVEGDILPSHPERTFNSGKEIIEMEMILNGKN